MTLDRSALVDGRPYGHHAVIEVTHNYGQRFTRIEAESWNDGCEPVAHSLSMPLSDGMDEEGAYAALSDALPEWEDPLEEVLAILTDEQAETVPNAFPGWAAGVAYAVGDRRRDGGLLYRCVQAHTSQDGWEPQNAPALWVRTAQGGETPEWVQPTGAHDAYAKGDKVRHDGRTWVSLIDGNVWEPGTAGTEGLWGEG